MSFDTIRPYFESIMPAVDTDFRQWEDPFGVDNIPSSILDKAWHILLGSAVYQGTAHTCLTFDVPVTLNVYLKGYRRPQEAVDMAWLLADAIIREATKPTNRLVQPKIKNVLPGVVGVRALASTNDNAAVLELQFNCVVIVG